MMRIHHNRYGSSAKTALQFAILLCILSVPALNGQTTSEPAGSPATVQDGSSGGQSGSVSQQSAKESNKPAGETDDEIKLKHSPSVQFVARLTGLSIDHAYLLCVLLNFAMVAGVVFWAAKKNLPGMFRNRTADIQKAMQEARKASEEANKRLADIESRLSRLDTEIGTMRSTAEKEAAAEEVRIKVAAEEDARRIVESAEQEIAAATKAARRELTAYAADLAVTLATQQIHVDSPTDQALVRSFAQELSENGGGPGKARQ
jgi:F-type H+-transporting ATPase subunit b